MSAKGEHAARGRPFGEQTEGPAGGLPSASDKHTHTGKDYCQLVYSHKVIFVFRKLELSPECDRQRGSVRSAAAAVHQAMKLLPGPCGTLPIHRGEGQQRFLSWGCEERRQK